MGDFVYIFIIIFVITSLIYFLYKIMIVSDDGSQTENLQITSGEIIEQLNILYKQRKFNIVESLARKYLEKKNGDIGVRSILAKAMHASGRTYEAIEQAKAITVQQPDNTNMQIFLANCYLKIENPMKAIVVYKGILEEYPENLSVIKQLAQVYFNTNQKRSAGKMYEKLCDLLDSNLEKTNVMTIIAEIHVEFNEIDMAISQYEQILAIYPEDIEIKKRLIDLYKRIPDYDSIVVLANDLILVDSDSENGLWAMKILMDVYNATHDYDKALEYAELIQNHPMADKIQLGSDVAKILLEKNQIDESIAMLKVLVLESPKNDELKRTLASAYEKNNDFESAVLILKNMLDVADARDIRQIHYEISALYSNWAMYLFSQKENDQCFKNFIIALQYYSQNPEIYFMLGKVNKEIKNFNEAIVQFKKAIELDKYNINSYYALAECYEEIGSIYEQKKVLSESLKYDANNSEVHFKLGLIYQTQNDIESAILHLKKAIELSDKYVAAMHNLALVYEHIGNSQEAIKLYNEIMIIEPDNQDVANNLKMMNS